MQRATTQIQPNYVVTHYLVSPGNTRNWSEDGVLGQLEYSPFIERME